MAGHGLLHTAYICPDLAEQEAEQKRRGVYRPSSAASLHRFQCGQKEICGNPGTPPAARFGQRRALEWQANYAMGIFKMPPKAVRVALGVQAEDALLRRIRQDGFEAVVSELGEAFDVSRLMATFRLMEIFPILREILNDGGRVKRAVS